MQAVSGWPVACLTEYTRGGNSPLLPPPCCSIHQVEQRITWKGYALFLLVGCARKLNRLRFTYPPIVAYGS